MNRKKIITLFSTMFITILLTLSIFFGAKALLDRILRLTYTECQYPETNLYLDNPYRGFYHIYGYSLKDEPPYSSLEAVPNLPDNLPEDEVPQNERLVQLQFNLRRFADCPIPERALKQMDMVLDAWSRTDYSIILRFLYDWDGRALETEPRDIERILQHMEQTAEIYNNYKDSIYMIHGLSTGNTGEMNNTNYGSPESLTCLATKLTEVSAPSIYLSVRTPRQWRSITDAESYEELAALPDSPFLGRLGLFNDGMLGSESDTGTYTDRTREEELAFQNELCRTVPNGGEVISDNPCNDLENAIRDMRTMHVSYLNSVHDLAVINKWKESIYHGNDVFDGVSGYEYIREHLGYRYVLRNSEITADTFGRNASLSLAIENIGFSASYRRFHFQLTLVNVETGERIVIEPDRDSSDLPGGETTVFEIPLDPVSYPLGTYEFYWKTTDDLSGEAILYGNDIPLTKYGYCLGILTVDAPYRLSKE